MLWKEQKTETPGIAGSLLLWSFCIFSAGLGYGLALDGAEVF